MSPPLDILEIARDAVRRTKLAVQRAGSLSASPEAAYVYPTARRDYILAWRDLDCARFVISDLLSTAQSDQTHDTLTAQ
jgi:hypothetical protein